MSKTTNKFSPEVRAQAVRMVLDHEGSTPLAELRRYRFPKDHVNRQFQAMAPNRLWVSDFTGHIWSHFPSRQAFHLA